MRGCRQVWAGQDACLKIVPVLFALGLQLAFSVFLAFSGKRDVNATWRGMRPQCFVEWQMIGKGDDNVLTSLFSGLSDRHNRIGYNACLKKPEFEQYKGNL